MSNRSYVCFECRFSKRAPAKYNEKQEQTCQFCGAKMIEVSEKLAIPKKNDEKKWKSLKKLVFLVK